MSYCSGLLSSSNKEASISHEDANELAETVEFIWYPKSDYIAISHVELSIDGEMRDSTLGFIKKGTIESRERAAKRKSGKGFFSFSIRVNPGEKAQIYEYLESKPKPQMCVSGACKLLNKNTGFFIPFPFSKIPTLAAIYLSLGRLFGHKRIERIDYVGKNKLLNLISPAVFTESVVSLHLGSMSFGLVVWIKDETGELVQKIIPIILGQNKRNESPQQVFIG